MQLRSAILSSLCCWVTAAGAASLEVTVSDEKNQPLLGAVVFLESPEAARAVKPLIGAEVAQRDKAFQPDLLVVTKGSAVHFPNRDTVRHHVYSFSPAKRFELKLYIGTPAEPVVFDQAGVVTLGCNIHDQMLGRVIIVDTPYYGSSGANGKVTLKDVPPGNYRLRVWHARLPESAGASDQALRLGATATPLSITLKGLRPGE